MGLASVALFFVGVGGFMMYEAYEAIHDKTTAAPLTKAKASLS
jgi:hypothetical protein